MLVLIFADIYPFLSLPACVCRCQRVSFPHCLKLLAVGWERKTSAPNQHQKHVLTDHGNVINYSAEVGPKERCYRWWKYLHTLSHVIDILSMQSDQLSSFSVVDEDFVFFLHNLEYNQIFVLVGAWVEIDFWDTYFWIMYAKRVGSLGGPMLKGG